METRRWLPSDRGPGFFGFFGRFPWLASFSVPHPLASTVMTMRQLIQQIGSNDLQAIRVLSKMLSIMDSYASLLTEAIEFLAHFDCYEYRLTVVTSCCRLGDTQGKTYWHSSPWPKLSTPAFFCRNGLKVFFALRAYHSLGFAFLALEHCCCIIR